MSEKIRFQHIIRQVEKQMNLQQNEKDQEEVKIDIEELIIS